MSVHVFFCSSMMSSPSRNGLPTAVATHDFCGCGSSVATIVNERKRNVSPRMRTYRFMMIKRCWVSQKRTNVIATNAHTHTSATTSCAAAATSRQNRRLTALLLERFPFCVCVAVENKH